MTATTTWVGDHGPAVENVFAAIDAMEAELDELVPPDVVELCRLRIAMLLGAATGTDELARWPTSARFDARDRACLGFAEQFVIDVTGVTRRDVDRLRKHFSTEQTIAFVNALWCAEGRIRLELVRGVAR